MQQSINHISFCSQRCAYREFGLYPDGENFASKFPHLAKEVVEYDLDHLMSDDFPAKEALSSALQKLPEYLSFLKTVLRNDFFFAAFDQTDESCLRSSGGQ